MEASQQQEKSETDLRAEARLQQLREAEYYCPGCGKTSQYPRECSGGARGHAPIEMVPTSEVTGDDPQPTAAPGSA